MRAIERIAHRWMKCIAVGLTTAIMCACSTTAPVATLPSQIDFHITTPASDAITVAASSLTLTGVISSRYPLHSVIIQHNGRQIRDVPVQGTVCELYVPVSLEPAYNQVTITATDTQGSVFQKTFRITNRYK